MSYSEFMIDSLDAASRHLAGVYTENEFAEITARLARDNAAINILPYLGLTTNIMGLCAAFDRAFQDRLIDVNCYRLLRKCMDKTRLSTPAPRIQKDFWYLPSAWTPGYCALLDAEACLCMRIFWLSFWVDTGEGATRADWEAYRASEKDWESQNVGW